MTEKRILILAHAEARKNAHKAIDEAVDGSKVTIGPPGRSLGQNAAQWPILEAFSNQLKWPVNGEMAQLTPDEYKDILTAAFQGESVRLAMGMSGGVVMLGMRTSKMSKKRFSEWLDFLSATAAMKGIVVYNYPHENTPTSSG